MKGKDKDFWLDDDPEWQELRQRIESEPPKPVHVRTVPPAPQHKATPSVHPSTPNVPTDTPEEKLNVTLNISIPKVNVASIKAHAYDLIGKLPPLTQQQRKIGLLAAGIVSLGVVASIGVVQLIGRDSDGKTVKDVLGNSSAAPDYDTVLPDGEAAALEGNIKYDTERKVTSFSDEIDLVRVTVSQQPIPENLKQNTDAEVEKLAKNFNATDIINESNPRAYLGNSIKGPQTVIFHKNGLLVFINSERQIDKASWAAYITKLL